MSVPTLQPPFVTQQAPVGIGQGFGEQVVLLPWYAPLHWAWVEVEHVPSAVQQAPVGCEHGLQTVLSPWYVPPHWPCAAIEHVPSAAQQAPVGTGQGLGEQTVPLPLYV